MNNTTSAVNGSSAQAPPSYTVYEYYEDDMWNSRVFDWEKYFTIVMALYKTGEAVAIILGLVSIFLLLSLTNADVRRRSVMWYVVHLTALCLFSSFVLEMMANGRHHLRNFYVCKFMVYSAEYVMFMCGYNIFLINMEVTGTIIFPLQRMCRHHVFRFVTATLATWLFVTFLVSQIMIDNNTAHVSRSWYCVIVTDKSAQMSRITMKEYLPTCLNFLSTVIAMAAYVYQKSRAFMAVSLTPCDATTAGQWLSFLIALNSLFVIRALLVPIHFHLVPKDIDHFLYGDVFRLIHTACFYLLPIPLFLIAEVRKALYDVVKRLLHLVHLDRLCGNRDGEPFSLSGVTNPNV